MIYLISYKLNSTFIDSYYSHNRYIDILAVTLEASHTFSVRNPCTLILWISLTAQAPDLTTAFTPAKSCFQYYKYRYTGDELTCLAGGTGAPSACTYMQLGPQVAWN